MDNIDRALAVLEASRRPGEIRIHPYDAVEALAKAGLIMTDLPEPSFVIDEDGEKRICWNTPDCDIELEPGEMIVTREAQAGHTIEDARQIGLALIAAANYRETA